MLSEHILRIVLAERGQTTDDVRIEGDDALLGSASHCHVRLSPDKVAKEQLRFEVRAGVVFAEVRATQPSVMLDRDVFIGGHVPEDAVLHVGGLEVRVSLERGRGAKPERAPRGRPRPILLAIGALVLVAVALVLIPRRKRGLSEAPEPPALFSDARDQYPCPEGEPAGALAAALELARIADAKRERAPFLPEEGLASVRAYAGAAACWERAGDRTAAATARQRADALRSMVERDYHLHQVRVHLARRANDSALLAREARVLASYVKGRSDRYVDWLDQLQRELEANTPREVKP